MNKVILLGNLTRDVELKHLQNNVPVANFGLAVNERWNDSETGEQRENVHFIEVEAWGRQAEVINEYFVKGSQMLLEGSLKFEQWDAEDGSKRSRLKVRLQRFNFTGKRDDNGNSNGNTNGNPNKRNATPAETAAPTTSTTDDDIPF